ncbi:MAG TPA: dihydrofolate reductase family protein [Acidobacteriaceae bacterium]|nr:dihydrofolate reductase family protein [Acidobacteriaceae bacterium]
MRRVIVSNLMSIDGFFESVNREIDWFTVEEEFMGYAREMLASVDTILFGRATYEHMAAHWPKAPRDPIADKMNSLPKIVFSRTLPEAVWGPVKPVRGDAAAEVARLKSLPGMDMVVLGSAALASSLLSAGLIDEYRVIVNPIVLGQGNPLFQNLRKRIRMQLTGVRRFASGVVMLSYQPQLSV